ncbi:MAG: hypothetical protein IJ461_05735 [Clostridia bacterium]|nr:hypothetical protein [Clostridia bacterium]
MRKLTASLLCLSLVIAMVPALAQEDASLWTAMNYPGLVNEATIHYHADAFEELIEASLPQTITEEARANLEASMAPVAAMLTLMDYLGVRYAYGQDSLQLALSLNGSDLLTGGIGWDQEKLILTTSLLPDHALVLGYEEALSRLGAGELFNGILKMLQQYSPEELTAFLSPFIDDAADWAQSLPFEESEAGLIHSESYEGHQRVYTWTVTGKEMTSLADGWLARVEADGQLQEMLLSLSETLTRETLVQWAQGAREAQGLAQWEETLLVELATDPQGRLVGGAVQVKEAQKELFALSFGLKQEVYCLEVRGPVSESETIYFVGRFAPIQMDAQHMVMDMLLRLYVDTPGMTVSQLAQESQAVLSYEYAFDNHLDDNGRIRFDQDVTMAQAYGMGARVTSQGGGQWRSDKADINLISQVFMTGTGSNEPLYTMNMHMYSAEVPPLDIEGKALVSIFRLAEDKALQLEVTQSMEKAVKQLGMTLYRSIPAQVVQLIMQIALEQPWLGQNND